MALLSLPTVLIREILKLYDLDSFIEFSCTNKEFRDISKKFPIYFPDVITHNPYLLYKAFPHTKALSFYQTKIYKTAKLKKEVFSEDELVDVLTLFKLEYFESEAEDTHIHTDKVLSALEKSSPNLKVLKMDCSLEDCMITKPLNFPNLEELEINFYTPLFRNLFKTITTLDIKIDDDCLEHYMSCSFPKLKNLSIFSYIDLPGNFFQNTKEIEKLVFHVFDNSINNDKPFNELHKLISLDIYGCREINGDVICDLVSLETLVMEECESISKESLMNLGKLKVLNIRRCEQMTDMIFTYPLAKSLMVLKFGSINTTRITNDGLVKLQNLESIDASSIKNSNITVDVFQKLPKLKSIDMCCSNFLTHETLGNVPIVNQMNLVMCGASAEYISAETLMHLKDIPHLTICTCYYKFLTEEILECWESHAKMQSITVKTYEDDVVFTDFKELRIHIEETLLEKEFDRLISARRDRKRAERLRKRNTAEERRLALERKRMEEIRKQKQEKRERKQEKLIRKQEKPERGNWPRKDDDDDSENFDFGFFTL